jgi:quercetin dioxygenase-like cupin family protein
MVYRWSDVERTRVDLLTVRQVIHGDHMTIARFELRKGATVPEHSHHNEQVLMVQSGVIRLVVSGEELMVGPAVMVRIPPYAPHMAEVLEDSVTIEVFSPPREDWK